MDTTQLQMQILFKKRNEPFTSYYRIGFYFGTKRTPKNREVIHPIDFKL